MDESRVVEELRHAGVHGRGFFRTQLRKPRIARAGTRADGAPARGLQHGAKDRADVADETQLDVAVAADVCVAHVDLHDDRRLEALAVPEAEVEGCSNDDREVGIFERVATRELEGERMIRAERTASGTVHIRRDVELLHEIFRDRGRPTGPHLLAEHDDRFLRAHDHVGERLDIVRVAHTLGRRAITSRRRNDGFRDIDLIVEHVARNFEKRRAEISIERFARRHRDKIRAARRGRHARSELRNAFHDVDVRQILQTEHVVLRARGLAADEQHRTLRTKRIRNAGHGIGRTRARRDDGATEAAGHARVAVGRVRRNLLVPRVDDTDAFVDAAVINVDDVATAQREDRVDAFIF